MEEVKELPKSISICGIKYKIEEVPVISKDTPLKGQINFLTNTILIDETMPLDLKYQTLIHEVFHAIVI